MINSMNTAQTFGAGMSRRTFLKGATVAVGGAVLMPKKALAISNSEMFERSMQNLNASKGNNDLPEQAESLFQKAKALTITGLGSLGAVAGAWKMFKFLHKN